MNAQHASRWSNGAACLALALLAACRTEPEALELAAGEARDAELDLARSAEQRFEVVVPADLFRLEVLLASEDADLDLAVASPDDPENEHVITCDAGSARWCIDRTSEPPLAPGRWSVRVAWPLRAVPHSARHDLSHLRFSLATRAFRRDDLTVLKADEIAEGAVDRDHGGARWYAIDVPDTAAALRIDVLDTPGDLDLAAGRGPLSSGLGKDEVLSQNVYGKESIVLRRSDADHVLATGRWYVCVFDPHDAEDPVPFRLRARFAAEPALDQLALPASLATSEDQALGFPLSAVVEIETEEGGGSGSLLTADGWILTNAHVVALRGSGTAREAIVSVTLDPAEPPVELFRARVEDSDEDLDLALLRVTSGFHGQPLPDGYAFPHLELGSAAALHAGDPLRVVGFPDTGGLGSRVTISVTSGVIAGFDARPAGRVLKTDAEITSGNSGGAAIDARGRLVGVPTSRVESGSGQLGYVHPIDWLPREWLARMRLARR